MTEEQTRETWEQIELLLEQSDAEALRLYLDSLSSAEVARAMSRLGDEDQAGVLKLLGPEEAADLLEELPDVQVADVMEGLEPAEAAAIVDEMVSDHRVDVLNEMAEEEAEAILAEMDPEEAEDARRLLEHPEDTAGGIMITEFLAYPADWTVGHVLNDLRENAETYSDFGVQYAYVLSDQGVLIGVLRLRDLLLSRDDARLSSVMIANPVYVLVDTPLEEVDRFFDRYPFVGVPVVDPRGHLLGVVRRVDAEEAYSDRAEQSFMRFSGIITGEEYRTMPLAPRSARRLLWLAVNLGLSLLAASVILRFEDVISTYIALVFFMPVVANMSGCTGNQAVAVSIRELANGLIEPQDVARVWLQEMKMALVIAVSLGLAAGFVAFLMHQAMGADSPIASEYTVNTSIVLGLVVGIALAMNAVVALSVGSLAPLVLRRVGIDPALVAPLVLTTVSDMCGFLLLLGLAYFAQQAGFL